MILIHSSAETFVILNQHKIGHRQIDFDYMGKIIISFKPNNQKAQRRSWDSKTLSSKA